MKMKVVILYLGLLDSILPAVDSSIASPHLWHSDLHSGNIFVDPADHTKITGIIDWQSTEASPLYFAAMQPPFLKHKGSRVEGFERPRLPDNFEELSEAEKRQAEALFEQRSLVALYRLLVSKYYPRLHKAFEFRNTVIYHLLQIGTHLLIDGDAIWLTQAVELQDSWAEIMGEDRPPCPLSFSDEERQQIDADWEKAELAMSLMTAVRESIRFPISRDGLVQHEYYKAAIQGLQDLKEQVIEQYAKNDEEAKIWEECWPFNP